MGRRENVPITPGANATLPARQDMVRYYAQCLEKHGHTITPDHLIMGVSVYVADSRQQAIKEAGPYMLYFLHTLFSHGNIANVERQTQAGYRREADFDYIRPENREVFCASCMASVIPPWRIWSATNAGVRARQNRCEMP